MPTDFSAYFDFSRGPPDVTGLSTKERLEVMRQYRQYSERAIEFDFTQGPPDVSHLEGTERLNVLRQYRQWQESQKGAFGGHAIEDTLVAPPAGVVATRHDVRFETATPRMGSAHQSGTGGPPWQPAPQGPDGAPYLPIGALSLEAEEGAAGVKSGAHGSVYTYFERPLTARDAHRVPPTAMQPSPVKPVVSLHEQALAEAAARAEAAAGAAGVSSTAHPTAWLGGWLDGDTPRNCRRLIAVAEKAPGVTEQRVFCPELAPNESLAEATRERRLQLLEARQAHEAAALAAKTAALEVKTALSAADCGGLRRIVADCGGLRLSGSTCAPSLSLGAAGRGDEDYPRACRLHGHRAAPAAAASRRRRVRHLCLRRRAAAAHDGANAAAAHAARSARYDGHEPRSLA